MFKATHIFMVYKLYIIHFMVNLEMYGKLGNGLPLFYKYYLQWIGIGITELIFIRHLGLNTGPVNMSEMIKWLITSRVWFLLSIWWQDID